LTLLLSSTQDLKNIEVVVLGAMPLDQVGEITQALKGRKTARQMKFAPHVRGHGSKKARRFDENGVRLRVNRQVSSFTGESLSYEEI
jgi:hypothetical protein